MIYELPTDWADSQSWGGEREYSHAVWETLEKAKDVFIAANELLNALPCNSEQEYFLILTMLEAGIEKLNMEFHRTVADWRTRRGILMPGELKPE